MYEEDDKAFYGFMYPYNGSKINHETVILDVDLNKKDKFKKRAREWESTIISNKKETIKFFKDLL